MTNLRYSARRCFAFLHSGLLWVAGMPVGQTAEPATTNNPFFAMDTFARGKPDVVVPLLKELGYSGLGGAAGDAAMATALESAGLRFFNGYLTLSFDAEHSALDDKLRVQLDAMQGHDAVLWLALAKVNKNKQPFPKSSPEADDIAPAMLREIADYAQSRGVKIALYPHTGMWIERVEDAIRVASKPNRQSVGVTFNLCHWLKLEGAERDPGPVLKAALPRLMFITINGADSDPPQPVSWGGLIQPLGEGTYDIAGFMRAVRAVGYTGPIGFQGFGIKAEPREVLTKTMAAWRKLNSNP